MSCSGVTHTQKKNEILKYIYFLFKSSQSGMHFTLISQFSLATFQVLKSPWVLDWTDQIEELRQGQDHQKAGRGEEGGKDRVVSLSGLIHEGCWRPFEVS